MTMPSARDLDLSNIVLHAPEMALDPMPVFEAARGRHPWLARCDQGILVTEYQAMKDLMSMDDRLRNPTDDIVEIMGAQGTGWGQFVHDMMLSSSGERHQRLR